MNNIMLNCCQGYRAGGSGHIYQDGRYSIWLGYGNCNHATNVFPHTYPYPGGNVNGGCYNDQGGKGDETGMYLQENGKRVR